MSARGYRRYQATAKPIAIITVGSQRDRKRHVMHVIEDGVAVAEFERLAEEFLDVVAGENSLNG